MSEKPADLPSLPLRLSNLQVLGLRDPDEGQWSRLRALQYSDLPKLGLCRALAQGCAVVIVASLYVGVVDLPVLAAWCLAQTWAILRLLRLDRAMSDLQSRHMTRRDYQTHALGICNIALFWAVALLIFGPMGDLAQHFALWGMVVMMMAGAATSMPATALGPVLFALIAGIAGAVSFAMMEVWAFAIASALLAMIIGFGSLAAARNFICARIAEAGVAVQSEVVSLLLREFEENDADWLWQIDTNRLIRSASPRFAYALGADPHKVEGKSFLKVLAGAVWQESDLPRSLHDLSDKLRARESFADLLVQVNVPEGRRWWELSGTPVRDEHGVFMGFRGVGSDVTEQRARDEKIAYLARYDTLTGLPNRLMLTEALRYAEHWRTRCALLMIDLDRFKAVNDSLGHQVGDVLLAKVSKRLSGLLGENDLCGRLGGDEFAVVIRDAGEIGAVRRIAEAIITTLSQPYTIDNHALYIGASVGSALGPRDGTSVEMLLRNADLALYRAKEEGGNAHFAYLPSLHAHAEERRQLEVALRQAIDKREMSISFQPVVDAASEQVVSFEALLRWNSSQHGSVSPGKFIPIAEDTRLIVPIGNWVLREACREAAHWPGSVKVAVNVSGEQLLEPGFSAEVTRSLADAGLAPRRLELEVTESVFLRDGRTVRQALEEILALGCSIALDDFGTGYSSLGYLRDLRFSAIKVDRSFVSGASQGSRESLAIINAVVAMARSLEMTTTAEGVEEKQQVELVRNLGCDKIQGYYYGRPMAADEARALLRERRAA